MPAGSVLAGAVALALASPAAAPPATPAGSAAPPPVARPAAAFDHHHREWTAVLAAAVHQGRVDYASLLRKPARLDAYLRQIEQVGRADYQLFSADQKLAFWINAYNAYTVRLVLDHYPVASIKEIGGFWQSPFKLEFIPLARLRGERISLDTIEHDILRRDFAEPRIHAALVCASRGCPELSPEAYRADRLDLELDQAMRRFLADAGKNRWDAATRTLHLSAVFRWFRPDFAAARGSLLAYVVAYLPAPAAAEVRSGAEPRIEFLDYDWSLNGS